jgi:hypothetical protein
MIYLASYKSTHEGPAGWINRGIRYVTNSEYSHSEIAVGNPFEGAVDCVSSSGIDGGVRVKRMKLSPTRWDILPLPDVKQSNVDQFLARESGAKYDFFGVARFLLPWLFGASKRRWFCSEACAAIIGFDEPWRFSPADLEIIIRKGSKQ